MQLDASGQQPWNNALILRKLGLSVSATARKPMQPNGAKQLNAEVVNGQVRPLDPELAPLTGTCSLDGRDSSHGSDGNQP